MSEPTMNTLDAVIFIHQERYGQLYAGSIRIENKQYAFGVQMQRPLCMVSSEEDMLRCASVRLYYFDKPALGLAKFGKMHYRATKLVIVQTIKYFYDSDVARAANAVDKLVIMPTGNTVVTARDFLHQASMLVPDDNVQAFVEAFP